MCPAGEIHGKPLARNKPRQTPSRLSAVLYQPAVLGVTARKVSCHLVNVSQGMMETKHVRSLKSVLFLTKETAQTGNDFFTGDGFQCDIILWIFYIICEKKTPKLKMSFSFSKKKKKNFESGFNNFETIFFHDSR